jgi:small subunit ribosomal protein S13
MIHPKCKLSELPEQKIAKLNQHLTLIKIDSALKKEISDNIKSLYDIGTYRGKRHFQGLPTKGQNTKHNASTSKKSNGRSLRNSFK